MHPTSRLAFALALFLPVALSIPALAGAQGGTPRVEIGDTVRVQLTDRTSHRGVVTRVEEEGFVIQRRDGTDTLLTFASPMARVDRLEGRHTRLGNAGKGFLRGAAFGVLAGGVIGLASYEDRDSSGFLYLTRLESAAAGAVVLSMVAIPVGTLIGAATSTERWRALPRDGAVGTALAAARSLRVAPTAAGGARVSLSVPLR